MTKTLRCACGLNLYWAGLATLLLLSALAEGSQSTEQQRTEAAKLIEQLDDTDPQIRRMATLRLNSLDGGVLPAAEAALGRDDVSPESRARLETALKYLRPRGERVRANAERQTWRSEMFHGAYRGGGHTGVAFDAQANAAIDAYLAMDVDPTQSQRDAAATAFQSAIDRHCADPLVLALARLVRGKLDPTISRPKLYGDEAIFAACCGVDYPAAVKFHVWATYMAAPKMSVMEDQVQRLSDLLGQTLATPNLPKHVVYDELQKLFPESEWLVQYPAWRKFIDDYARLAGPSPDPLLFRANILWRQAVSTQAKLMNAKAYTPTDDQKFHDALLEACKLAEQAWQGDPADTRAADFILEMQSKWLYADETRQHMELWFSRATDADPDDRRAFELKAKFLLAPDNLNPQDVVQFGRECLRSENWRGGTPLIAVMVHEHAADHSADRQAYLSRPDVWDDIHFAYDGYLINFPADLTRRCEYAKLAGVCGHWDEADRQFQQIGDHPVMDVFGSESSYKYLRAKAHRLASAATPPDSK